MPKGKYSRTEEHKKKIVEARKRYFDQKGRVVNINQKEDPKGYQREYQRIWRKNHPHYYRDKARAKARRAKRKSLKDIQEKFRKHLNTVPKEYRAAVVEDYLDKLVSNGWLRKEDRANIHYNPDYKE